jgi:predicted nucleic acid-binding Zn ribbon protein
VSQKDLSPEERATRGKRLLFYGMFALVVVTVVSLFLVLWLWLAPLGLTSIAIQTTLLIGAITIIACVIVWFIYTKLILKE